MIYLIVQMIVALGLAAICGGAIGWLIHRTTHSQHIQKLRHALGRLQNQLAQSQSEISMLTDDYEELQRRSQDEIDLLRQDNEQIPFLNNNLEKSQLLVRQMMQKHESKVRDLTTENQSLTAKLKTIEDREQAHNKVQAELDRLRRKNQANLRQDDGSSATNVADTSPQDNVGNADRLLAETDSVFADTPATTTDEQAASSDQTASDTLSTVSDARSAGSWASAPLIADIDEDTDDVDELDVDGDPFDNVMEVGDELQRELDIDAQDDLLLDGSGDASSLFDPVEQRDDLKQIFGIGPVTEKALNQLGITSYSQLADLKSHDIEKIAGVLQIVPGRIERDDWVGNARRQLEDVLEQL